MEDKNSDISIHAPLAGCDAARRVMPTRSPNFNPRTPCGVRRRDDRRHPIAGRFQSTHPLRGAKALRVHDVKDVRISIHAPLAGCDGMAEIALAQQISFQSTHPLRGATNGMSGPKRRFCILIHAPLAGCDDVITRADYDFMVFQSTHPLRGATKSRRNHPQHYTFQSTHPLRGATFSASSCDRMARFQSTHPLRGATNMLTVASGYSMVSIHAPLAGCDQLPARMGQHDPRFNPRTPSGVPPVSSASCAKM